MTEAVDAATAVADRVMSSAIAMTDVLAIALGDRLGYYRTLAQLGDANAAELAGQSGTTPRYAREWLEQQAVTGLLLADDHTDGAQRRYQLAPGVADVLVDENSLAYLAPVARQLVAAARQVPSIADAFENGGGVGWAQYGADMRESEADLNRPGYLQLLADDWMAALPDVQQRLRADPPARIADIGCGAGWSTIALAQGYPLARVDGFDVDEPSVDLARRNIADAGVGDRAHIQQIDIGAVEVGEYDLVTAFECLHDMPYPVDALRSMRRLAKAGGTVLVADMKVADTFSAPGDDVERLMYGFSVLICLPDSMSSPGSAATGTVMRTDTLRDYAQQAGFSDVTVLPVEHDIWRFYRLTP